MLPVRHERPPPWLTIPFKQPSYGDGGQSMERERLKLGRSDTRCCRWRCCCLERRACPLRLAEPAGHSCLARSLPPSSEQLSFAHLFAARLSRMKQFWTCAVLALLAP